MKAQGEGQNRRGLWYWLLTATLPLTALMLSAAIVLLAIAFSSVRPVVLIELGELSPDAEAFVRTDVRAAYETTPEERYRAAGDYRLKVKAGIFTVPVTLQVSDTIAPTAFGTETTISTKKAPTPDKLIKNLRDQSVVKVTFETAPEYGTIGDYDAVVLLEDASGNRTRVPVTVHIRATVDAIAVEAGDPAPEAEAFLIDRYETVEMQPITEEMLREPGDYTVHITADGVAAESRLIVRDTVPPTGSGVTRIAAPGEPLLPEDFVTDVSDETAVTAAFVIEPDPANLDQQTVCVVLTDRGGNTAKVYSTLLITSVTPIEIEAHDTPLEVDELQLEGEYIEAKLSWAFVPNEPGPHVISVLIDGREHLALIEVIDTTPPVIEPLEAACYRNDPHPVETFAAAKDATGATLAFLEEPDWSKEIQDVTVAATDACGNRSELTFPLKLITDTEPPVLSGMQDRICYVDEAVSFLNGVTARDNCDGEIAVSVDTSKVNSAEWGSYPVTYSATDRAGNTATATVTFRFVYSHVSEERAQEVADKYIAKILNDGMTLAEQIEAIYDYVFKHVRYSARSDKQDWRSEAVRGLTTGRGDCFTAYAAARLLLEQTDAQIVSVTRKSTNSHHYWLLVNIGTGWYHFDACRAWTGKYRCFMWTDAETRRHSKTYWSYDKSLYPPVATEPYNGGN